MNFKKIGIVLLLVFSILPIKALAQTSNAGFVPGNIWYSNDPFEEGDKIRIYTLIFNPDARQLSGTVLFFDNSVLLGKKDFTVAAKDVKDIFTDWSVTVGDHTIFAKIENSKFLLANGKFEDVYLAENKTTESKRTVNKKITLKDSDPITKIINTNSIIDFGKTIEEKTPDFITKPVIISANAVENFRSEIGISAENKKTEIKKDLGSLAENKSKANPKKETSLLLKPYKYVQLFFLYFFSFIFNNKFIFYGLFCIVLFLLLRYIWRLIF